MRIAIASHFIGDPSRTYFSASTQNDEMKIPPSARMTKRGHSVSGQKFLRRVFYGIPKGLAEKRPVKTRTKAQ